MTGKLRIWGNNYIKDGYLGEYWREAFKKFQPRITIEYNLPTTGIAIPSLSAKVTDLAMSRKATLMDLLSFANFAQSLLKKVSSWFLTHQSQGLPVRVAGFRDSPQTPVQICSRRVREIVIVQIAARQNGFNQRKAC